ncbi:ABC transporter ATP-binding protein/permease [Dehalococcoidia bacterium]|nr:ABC transporter ATP-binding protein/permease [Dehalococcoidia bacterium]
MNNSTESKKEKQKRPSLRRLYTVFYRPDWPWHLLLLVVLGGTMALFTGLAIMLRRLADLAFTGAAFDELLRGGLLLAAVLAGIAALDGIRGILLHYVMRVRLLDRVRPALMEKVLSFPLNHFTTHSPGDLLAVVSGIANNAADGVITMIQPIFVIIQTLYLVLVMAFISLPLTVGVLVLLGLFSLVTLWFRRRQERLFGPVMKNRRRLTGTADDIYQGYNEIKQNALEGLFTSRFAEEAWIFGKSVHRFMSSMIAAETTTRMLRQLLPAVVLFVAALPALAAGMDKALLITLYTLALLLVDLLNELTRLGTASATGLTAWADLIEIVEGEPERQGGLAPAGHHIEWKKVSRRMRDTLVLDGVSLTIREGEKVMICGRSGEGKSTMLKMLPGLLDADSGEVRLGDVLSNEANPADLRALVGFVPQDPYLFETTLRENLTYGRSIPEAEVDRIIQLVQLEEFVRALPDGLDTRLGPDGATVSGGEKARIALARAILRRPNILILDEATASLDSETEERIYRHLLQMSSTVVGVTHRLSTLKMFPRIVALANGRVALDGHTEEVVTAPIFQELFAYQMEPEAAS